MAQSSLPVFTRPEFSQVLEALADFEIRHVNKTLGLCCWESPESVRGACDGGFPCRKSATVTDIESGCGYCLKHFEQEVALG